MSSTEERTSRSSTLPPGHGYGEDLPDGFVVDKIYRVEEMVAQAGFSNVYRATERATGRAVALKVLHQALAKTPKGVERFQREFTALAGLQHPHVVQMISYGTLSDGRPYTAMEWIEGSTLRGFMGPDRLEVAEVLPVFTQLCDALQGAHDAGVIHRDLKASNIMLTRTDDGPQVKLVDFGIAKAIDPKEAAMQALTTTGQALGTPYTMAPEQITGRPLDGRTDIYALGVVLFEMLAGEKPFTGHSAIEVAEKHLSEQPPSVRDFAAVPKEVDAVVQTCLAKKPDDRYSTPREAAEAFAKAAAKQGPAPVEITQDGFRRVPAMGLHFELTVADTDDDELVEDAASMVQDAVERCQAKGMRIAVRAGNSFLAVLPVPHEGPRALELRATVMELALTLSEELPTEVERSDQVCVRAIVHRAEVETSFKDGSTAFVGGALLDIGAWVHNVEGASLTATQVAIEGMEEFMDTQKMPGLSDHLRILGLVR